MSADPVVLDSIELWQLRAFEQGDEATGMMLAEISDSYSAGRTHEANVRIAITSARKRLSTDQSVREDTK